MTSRSPDTGTACSGQKVNAESQKDGRIVSKVVSVFMDPTDDSAIK